MSKDDSSKTPPPEANESVEDIMATIREGIQNPLEGGRQEDELKATSSPSDTPQDSPPEDVLDLTQAVEEDPLQLEDKPLRDPRLEIDEPSLSMPGGATPPDAEESLSDRLKGMDEIAPILQAQLGMPPVTPIAGAERIDVKTETTGGTLSMIEQLVTKHVQADSLVKKSSPLGALIEDSLHKMLKAWLDEHLPAIVEKVVREEIGHLSGSE